jgi:protein SCO1/2
MGRLLGDYTLKNTEGRPVSLASYRGKPLLVSFIYTGCFQICPTTTRNLKRAIEAAQRTLGPESFNVVSIGFNLPADTSDALHAFAREQGVNLPNWQFLSPDPATLDALSRDLGFSYVRSPRGFDHVIQVSVLDRNGRVYRQVYGDDFPLPQLVGPLKELITGSPSSDEGLTGFLERVRILCTVYDPASGAYRIKYSVFFELFGGLFGLILFAWYFVHELRRSRAARGT